MNEDTKEVACCLMGMQYLQETVPAKIKFFRDVQMLAEKWNSGAVIQGYAIEQVHVKFCPWCGTSFKKAPRRHARAQQKEPPDE